MRLYRINPGGGVDNTSWFDPDIRGPDDGDVGAAGYVRHVIVPDNH